MSNENEFFKEIKSEFKDLGSKMNRLFSDIVKGRDGEGEVSVHVDVYEFKGEMVFEFDLPGFKKEEVKVQVVDGRLIVSGKRSRVSDTDGVYFHVRERRFGSFQREFSLQEGIDPSMIKAKFENGMLFISLPLAEDGKSKSEVKID